MAVVKMIFKCDICGKGCDASKIVCITTTNAMGQFISKKDMCVDCRGEFNELLEEIHKKSAGNNN